jgi:[FeFe] hydrogenase H-cluster maturation GTPase HydF
LTKVAQSERKHIAFVGRRNAGKSSLVNRFIGQDLVIVSDSPGTTTDPVKKAMELLPFGPVVLVDTAGIDDVGELGEKRIGKTIKIISESDFAVLVLDSQSSLNEHELNLIQHLNFLELPFRVVINKSDLGVKYNLIEELNKLGLEFSSVSCTDNKGIPELKQKIINLLPADDEQPLLADLLKPDDLVVLVVPIDPGAPKGRIILPQVHAIRESLDASAISLVVKETELRSAIGKLNCNPALVVTDSQAIERVNSDIDQNIPLTTFSILMARYKGDLREFIKGLITVEKLNNNDKILIAEACSHHPQVDDIGRVKIPGWLKSYTGKELDITVRAGHDYPENLGDYKLIIHCGGCMLTRRTMQTRIKQAQIANIPIVNYGVLISYLHGAVPRVLKPFSEAMEEWEMINKLVSAG